MCSRLPPSPYHLVNPRFVIESAAQYPRTEDLSCGSQTGSKVRVPSIIFTNAFSRAKALNINHQLSCFLRFYSYDNFYINCSLMGITKWLQVFIWHYCFIKNFKKVQHIIISTITMEVSIFRKFFLVFLTIFTVIFSSAKIFLLMNNSMFFFRG